MRPEPRRLPPLNALRTFEVAGRLGSIRAAAEELVVTPGAVSRQVRVLESWLGVALFQHEGRGLRLTADGARYLEAVTRHLAAIGAATDELTGRAGSEHALHLRAYTLFATHWLIPRLAEFHQSQPWVALELTTSSRPDDFGQGDVDAEILPAGRQTSPGFETDVLVADEVVLVCSPAYRERYRLAVPADVARLPAHGFLRSAASPELWDRWFAAAGLTGLDARHGPGFGDSSLTCRAAAAGQGVALAPLTFVAADLAADQLVMPFAQGVGPLMRFCLTRPADRQATRAFTAFRAWLLSETAVGRSAAEVEGVRPG
ncbi:LysR substrate-binding domain-containing protein [Actinophytocola sediminis]